ncbi:hypothetical protein AGMMS49944_16220 [Spirochaetia bacterium]|nr:hypothetical protein AGMMS49944_16220 [Spirochaetia bacterium]
MNSKCGAGIAAMRFDWPRQADFCEWVREMDYRIFSSLIVLKKNKVLNREQFIEEWRRNQKRMSIEPTPTTAYLLGPPERASFLQRLCWRFGIGRFSK